MQSTYQESLVQNQSLAEQNQKLTDQVQGLVEQNRKLTEENKQLKARIRELEATVAMLLERLGINSKNSSKPPSSDMKPSSKGGAKRVKKKRAKGFFRQRLPKEEVNDTISCELEACPHCQSKDLVKRGKPAIFQTIEIKKSPLWVTDYERQRYYCKKCKRKSHAHLPKGVGADCFGPRLRAAMGMLTGVFHISRRRTAELLDTLLGLKISVGSISMNEERVSKALDGTYKEIQDTARDRPVAKHADETGWRLQGQRYWVWLLTTEKEAYFRLDQSRSKEAASKLLGSCKGSLVTDRLASYNVFKGSRQYCLAHALREATCMSERAGIDGEIGEDLRDDIFWTLKAHREYREGCLSRSAWRQRLRRYEKGMEETLLFGAAAGKVGKTVSTCRSLLKDFSRLWTFAYSKGMEPTNNLAERDLRRLVIWRKISFGSQSDRGCRFVERIMSVSTTLRKRGHNAFDFIYQAMQAQLGLAPIPILPEPGH